MASGFEGFEGVENGSLLRSGSEMHDGSNSNGDGNVNGNGSSNGNSSGNIQQQQQSVDTVDSSHNGMSHESNWEGGGGLELASWLGAPQSQPQPQSNESIESIQSIQSMLILDRERDSGTMSMVRSVNTAG